MFHLLNSFKNIEMGHFTRRRKLPHSTLRVVEFHGNGDSIEHHAEAAQQDLQTATHGRCLRLVAWVFLRVWNVGIK